MRRIIIVGAGTAGMACAISAAQRGIQVRVVEKDSVVGGTLHLTAGHLSAGGTLRQLEKGIEDSPAQHYDDVMRIGKHTAQPELVRLATELAPHTLNWLQSLGFPFEPATPSYIYGHTPYQIPRTYWGTTSYQGTEIKWAGSAIYETLIPLWYKYVEEGLIQLHLNTRMQGLLAHQNKIRGIELSSGEAWEAEVVVLTTGGYGANPEFFGQMHPTWRLISTARPTSTGDGAMAAIAIGAKFHNQEKHTATLGGLETQPQSGRTDFWKNWARVSNAVDRKPREIYVNAHGLRFMDENMDDPDPREKAAEAQPAQKFWVIFDHHALYDEGGCLVPQWSPERLEAEASQGVFAWKADSIAELAQKTGLSTPNLMKTVNEFNQAVAQQRDDAFGRTYLKHALTQPPFYALLTHCFSLVTFGGLAVNADLQVLDTTDQPIEGLFAAGEIIGGGALCGKAFVGGMFLTPALSFGRYLGQKLS